MSYAGGKRNWLITIFPYFFPTFSVLLAVLLGLIDPGNAKLANGLLGVTLAYHAISSFGDFHREQTDLQEVGFPFSWIFLPSANLLPTSEAITPGEGARVNPCLTRRKRHSRATSKSFRPRIP